MSELEVSRAQGDIVSVSPTKTGKPHFVAESENKVDKMAHFSTVKT
jgi:hypothetical protein